ncbi:hypothetical protein M0804_013150 [Polistes exclamans]|nr:hypothetical protein M0804_013150 [Polistes exclamans]
MSKYIQHANQPYLVLRYLKALKRVGAAISTISFDGRRNVVRPGKYTGPQFVASIRMFKDTTEGDLVAAL